MTTPRKRLRGQSNHEFERPDVDPNVHFFAAQWLDRARDPNWITKTVSLLGRR